MSALPTITDVGRAHPSQHLAAGLFVHALIQKPFSGLSLGLNTAKPAMLHHQTNTLLEGMESVCEVAGPAGPGGFRRSIPTIFGHDLFEV